MTTNARVASSLGPAAAIMPRAETSETSAAPFDEVRDIAAQCVQCGLCNAVCPTFLLERDERDGPRGRIIMIAKLFASGPAALTPEVGRHIDRCLSCFACTAACPAGVDFAKLMDHSRSFLHDVATPSLQRRMVDWAALRVTSYPRRLSWLLKLVPLAKRLRPVLQRLGLKDLAALIHKPPHLNSGRPTFSGPGTAATTRERRGRVILLAGCAQQVLRPSLNDATIRLLARSGIDVEISAGAGCCGRAASLSGDVAAARQLAKVNVDAWWKSLQREADGPPIDAIITNTAGCGIELRRYSELLRDDPEYAGQAKRLAALACDVTEYLAKRGLGPPRRWSSLKVAYQAPCALRHGQGVVAQPTELIYQAGFTVIDLAEPDVCCGSGGSYAYREPQIANALRQRKLDSIQAVRPDIVATGSIACLKHLEDSNETPIVHTVELLDWAHGGPVPRGLEALAGGVTDVPGPPPLDVQDYIRS